jgi:glycosyltransferase involved in cell wall biosynthesis
LARLKVLYSAAHAGAAAKVPIGGGGAVSRMLLEEWRKTQPFEVETLSPRQDTPEDIVRFSQREYTAFCHRFRRETTREILDHRPEDVVVLANDISEGPDFAQLASRGYRIVTLWHVDVVAFVARMYLKGLLRPELLARAMTPLEAWLPGPLQLVFTNQHNCVRHSRAHVVMTGAMKSTILACYPETPPSKIRVIPWGAPSFPERLEKRPGDVPTLLTLSRISPEKGQHRLLEALRDYPGPLRVVIAGEAAYMGGSSYAAKLRRLAGRLRNIEVLFPGHLSGQAKADAFASADLYIFPSVSESYGLTLMEALAHGVPAIAFDHDGAKAILNPDLGVLVRNKIELRDSIGALLADPSRRARMSAAARLYAGERPFSQAAGRVAALLQEVHS